MRHLVLIIACIMMLCTIADAQIITVPAAKRETNVTHSFGARTGIVGGFYGFPEAGDGFNSSVVPGFVVAGYYRFTKKRFMVMPELSVSREGGGGGGDAVITDTGGVSYQGQGKVGVVVYNMRLKAFIGLKTRKGFMLYGGPALAFQLSGRYSESFTVPGGPSPMSYSINVKMVDMTTVIPEIAVGLGYDIKVGKEKRYGVTLDLQLLQGFTTSNSNVAFGYQGQTIKIPGPKFNHSALQFMVGFRI